jgi:hypothetical protein
MLSRDYLAMCVGSAKRFLYRCRNLMAVAVLTTIGYW